MAKITLDKVTKMADFTNCIFIRKDFTGDWIVYLDAINEPFYSIEDAIKYFRENNKERNYFQLATYKDALSGGGWDNI